MKVKELIEILQKQESNMEVVIKDGEEYLEQYSIKEVVIAEINPITNKFVVLLEKGNVAR